MLNEKKRFKNRANATGHNQTKLINYIVLNAVLALLETG